LVLVAVALAGCGGSKAVHYNVQSALDCLQRTNSTRAGGGPNSIFLLFVSPDGMSAVEPVFVSFGPATVAGAVPAGLGVMSRKPSWTDRRGDARMAGYGPYEPPIAKREHIPDVAARAAVKKLGADVRAAIDACLKKNVR
jgi:hypothetical protein